MLHPIVSPSAARRRGMSMIYTVLSLAALLGFVSLGVDLARVQAAKTELRSAVDAAARAGAGGLATGVSAAQSNAQTIAASQTVDGSALTLDVTNDIEFGTWDLTARTFSVLTGANRSNANAIRITGRRTAARNTAIPLVFAQVLGARTCDITARAIAYSEPGNKLELVGTSFVSVMNNFYAGTYRSSTTTSPSTSTAIDGATVASNGAISAGMNENVKLAILGPSATSNLTTNSTNVTLTSALSFALPTASGSWSDVTVSSGTYYIPGGTYYVNNLSISNQCTLSFTGPATLYVSGNVKFNGDCTIAAYNSVPGNLQIYHTGSGSFGSATANNTTIIADMYAPGVDLSVKNNANLYGRFIVKSVTAKNNLSFFYDEDLSPPMYIGGTGGAISLVK
jgi:hypothetical protein